MKTRKDAYELSSEGEILKYHINYDVERFSFITNKTGNISLFEKMVDKINSILNDFVGTDFELDWEDIMQKYLEEGVGDVPHFASQYVFGNFLLKKRSHEKELMQTMYLKIVDRINKQIEKGKLPG